ncbi:MAG: hypothetical protein R6V57_04225 [Vicinamibacterales bacterium]
MAVQPLSGSPNFHHVLGLTLKATRDAQVARAKVDLDAAIVAFQASLEDFRRTFTTPRFLSGLTRRRASSSAP